MIDNIDRKIFILNGVHSTGKDTFVKYINDFGINAFHTSYVDFTRFMLSEARIDVKNKTDKMRKLLCDVNTALEEYDDIPFKDCCEIANDFNKNWIDDDWLIIDCREPKKIERLKQKLNAKTIFIKSDKKITADNSADKAVAEDYEYDYIIDNTGSLDDLKNNTMEFIKTVTNIKGVFV